MIGEPAVMFAARQTAIAELQRLCDTTYNTVVLPGILIGEIIAVERESHEIFHQIRVRADALGRWAFHCHLLYHMAAGMFREVRVDA